MAEKVQVTFDEQAIEVLNNIYPELRNAAVNIAIKMFSKTSMYKKYFCINCKESEAVDQDDAIDLDELENKTQNNATEAATQSTAQQTQQQVISWDQF